MYMIQIGLQVKLNKIKGIKTSRNTSPSTHLRQCVYCNVLHKCILPTETCEALCKNRGTNTDLEVLGGSKKCYYIMFTKQI